PLCPSLRLPTMSHALATPPADNSVQDSPAPTLSEAEIDAALSAKIAQLSERATALTLVVLQLQGGTANPRWRETQDAIDSYQAEMNGLRKFQAFRQQVREDQQQPAAPSSSVAVAAASAAPPVAPTDHRTRLPDGLPKFRSGQEAIHEPHEFVDRFQLIMKA